MIPDLSRYDVILVNSSAGKDSQAMLDFVYELAAEEFVRDRMTVVHCDLGRVEWPGTRELAQRQAEHYGLRFEVVSRDRDLLHQIEFERKMFPDSSRRYCTSDQKTHQVLKLITRLTLEAGGKSDTPIRILNCLGLRASESTARAKKVPFGPDKVASNGKRQVDRWLPIHHWSTVQVWDRIRLSGVESHPAYAQGMPRLSCSFCVLSNYRSLVRAAQLRPELAAEYAAIEERIGHRFRKDLSMAQIISDSKRADVLQHSQVQGDLFQEEAV